MQQSCHRKSPHHLNFKNNQFRDYHTACSKIRVTHLSFIGEFLACRWLFSRQYVFSSEWIFLYLDLNRTEFCSWEFYGQISQHYSSNGLVPNRQRAIAWTNDDPFQLSIYVSLSLNGLRKMVSILTHSTFIFNYIWRDVSLQNGKQLIKISKISFSKMFKFHQSHQDNIHIPWKPVTECANYVIAINSTWNKTNFKIFLFSIHKTLRKHAILIESFTR